MKPRRQTFTPDRESGFTLIELVIAMAIAAMLTAIAVPSYRDYVRRGQLADAFSTLADMRVKMEQYYQDNKFYGTGAATTTCATLPGYSAFPVTTKYFSIDCAAVGAAPVQGYTLTASGSSGGLASGYDYTLNHAGAKRTTNFAGAAATAACWATKSANACDN